MAGVKGKSGGPRANSGGARPNSGGKRPGAGRPKRQAPATADAPSAAYDSAEDFLRAVVEGREAADAVRVRAAQTLLRYETAPLRAPPQALPAKELAVRGNASRDAKRMAEWEQRASEIKARFKRGKT